MEELQVQQRHFPMLVSDQAGIANDVNNIETWKKGKTLSSHVHDLLYAQELGQLIAQLQRDYRLSNQDTEEVSRSVRRYFFSEISEQEFARTIGAMLRTGAAGGARALNAIMSLAPVITQATIQQEQQIPHIQMTLTESLAQYPAIAKQNVTGASKIISKPFLNPITPTVEHWIAVYERVASAKKHTDIERGEFLYRSQACRVLPEKSRHMLGELLRAYDTGGKLTIDASEPAIVFSPYYKTKKVQVPKVQKKDTWRNPARTVALQQKNTSENTPKAQRVFPKNVRVPKASSHNGHVLAPEGIKKTLQDSSSPRVQKIPSPLRMQESKGMPQTQKFAGTNGAKRERIQKSIHMQLVQKEMSQEQQNIGKISFSSGQTLPIEQQKKGQQKNQISRIMNN